MVKTQTAIAFLLSVIASNTFAIQRSPWSFGYDLLLTSDDNIGRSQWETDIEQDIISRVNFNGRYSWSLNQTNALSLTGFAHIEEYQDFDGLSNQGFELQLKYSFKTRFSFSSPLYSIILRSRNTNYETDNRDGSAIELGFQYMQLISDRITLIAAISSNQQDAQSNVFDLKQNRYLLNVDYRINERWSLYLSYNYIDGDVFSVATANDSIYNWADIIELDPAFSQAENTSYTTPGYGYNPTPTTSYAIDKYAYRLPAKTAITRLGLNFGINRNNSIDISGDIIDSNAAGPINYESTVLAVNYLHRF